MNFLFNKYEGQLSRYAQGVCFIIAVYLCMYMEICNCNEIGQNIISKVNLPYNFFWICIKSKWYKHLGMLISIRW